MNKRTIVLSLLAAIALSSCSADTETSETKEAAKPETAIELVKAKKPQPVGPWLFTLQKVTTPGQTMKSWLEEKPTEAVGQWAIAHVQVTNVSKARQSLKEVLLLGTAKMVDDKGASKEVDGDVTSQQELLDFEEKPLKPGESRTVKLVFDVPAEVSIARVDIPAAKSSADIKVLPSL
ncbi:MAG: DUF4352 domain-containing protein [Microcoleus sp.]